MEHKEGSDESDSDEEEMTEKDALFALYTATGGVATVSSSKLSCRYPAPIRGKESWTRILLSVLPSWTSWAYEGRTNGAHGWGAIGFPSATWRGKGGGRRLP